MSLMEIFSNAKVTDKLLQIKNIIPILASEFICSEWKINPTPMEPKLTSLNMCAGLVST